MNICEVEIVKLLRDGDKAAYTQIYRLYFYRVFAFLNNHLSNDDLSQEISQEVFFRLWINHSKLDVQIPIGSYLYAIAKNIVADYYKHKNVERRYVAMFLNKHQEHHEEQRDLAFNEINEIIERSIAAMPRQQALVFRMSRLQGMLNDQIAEELRISKRTVEKHISNSIKAMRKALKCVLTILILLKF